MARTTRTATSPPNPPASRVAPGAPKRLDGRHVGVPEGAHGEQPARQDRRSRDRARQGRRHLRRAPYLGGSVAPLRRHAGARPCQPRHRAVGDPLPARTVGLRQVDPAQDRRGRRAPVLGPRADRRPGGGGAEQFRAARAARHRADVPGLRAVPAPHHPRQCRLRPQIAHPPRGQRRGPRRAGTGRARRITPANIRISCRAASSSGWRWPAPSPRARACC